MNENTMQNSFFLGLLGVVTVVFLAMLAGFFQAIFWAVTLGILFLPLQRFLEAKLNGRRSLAAVLSVFAILITVIVPAFFVASAVVGEAGNLYARIQSGEVDPGAALRWAQQMSPRATEWAAQIGIEVEELRGKVSELATKGSQYVASLALTAGQNVARFAVLFFLMLYLLFFVLREGDSLLDHMIRALPLGDERERTLFAKFAEVSRATIKGTLIVGMVQGTLGGILFWALGIEAAVFWGVVMVLLSVLPAVGAGLVWLPAAIVLAANGDWMKAAIMVGVGALVIGMVDNLLRPMLVGRDTKMPDYVILLSTLGGLTTFGISGFVIGPVIAALFIVVWDMFAREHAAMPATESPDGD